MTKWADFLISKEKWIPHTNTIESFIVHVDNHDTVGNGIERNRKWIVDKLKSGYTFCCIIKDESGKWNKSNTLSLNIKGGLIWNVNLPIILPKRKTFVSYYHKDDKAYKEKFKNLTFDLVTNKSVEDGNIDAETKDAYVKKLIQNGFLDDITVLVVLLGPKTKCRKHVDWEISGALNLKVGDNFAGVLGLKLPTHSDFGTGKYSYALQPQRLTDNLKTGYAVIRDYTTDRKKLQEYIELAFKNRSSKYNKRTNSRIQMKINTCS